MNEIELELRRAFSRKEPSTRFAGRVARAAGRRGRRERQQKWMAAAAALLLCVAGGGYWQMRREAVRAVDELNLAMQITGQKLMVVQQAAARGLAEKNFGERTSEQ